MSDRARQAVDPANTNGIIQNTMIDKTNIKFESEADFKALFVELTSSKKFADDKTVDIKVSPTSYMTATYLSIGIPEPMRVVFGDYEMHLYC